MNKNDIEQPKAHSFNILRDEVEETDLFNDKTHNNIADSIAELIKTKDGGITIGLEGSWGSGKSTIISILNSKLKDLNYIRLIQFDAWAHQGDPLRRIFLESLIDKISTDGIEGLQKIKEKIAKRQKTIEIKSTRSVTTLGKLLSLSAFFVPIGLALISLVKNVEITIGGKPDYLFMTALFFTSMPLVPIVGNLFYMIFYKLKNRNAKIFASEHWAFLREDTVKDISQEVSEEDERSSIEFEKYFNQIIDLYFMSLPPEARLILVIDNLDRVNTNDALIMWSTLQTFLQQRNYITKKNWFNKIWIIVPYDPDGLAALWSQNDHSEGKEIPNDVSKAFFDKNFQIRYEVPKQVISGWESFTQTLIDKAFIGWDFKEKKDALRILRLTRTDIIDIPTPREIKNYINHLGALVFQNMNKIPIASVAYYIILRYVSGISKKNIRENLVMGNIPDIKHTPFLPPTIQMDIAGLLFGVPPERGNEILLEPIIQNILSNGKNNELTKLADLYGKDFWPVFNYHIDHCSIGFGVLLNYARSIQYAFGNKLHHELDDFFHLMNDIIKSDKISLGFNRKEEMEGFISLIKLFYTKNQTENILFLYDGVIDYLGKNIKDKKQINIYTTQFYETVILELIRIKIPIKKKEINFQSSIHFIEWVKSSTNYNFDFWEWIAPLPDSIKDITQEIKVGSIVTDGVSEAIKYTIKSGVTIQWAPIITQCKQYINFNNGTYNSHSDDVFEIITLIGIYSGNDPNIIDFLLSGQYLHLFSQRFQQNIIHVSIIYGFIFTSELHKLNAPNHGQSLNGFQKIKSFWMTSDKNNAALVLNYFKPYKKLDFIWKLAEDAQNKLIGNIIELIINDTECSYFFNVKDALNKIKIYYELVEDAESIKDLSKALMAHSHIVDEILNNSSIDVINDSRKLLYIVEESTNQQMTAHIATFIKSVSKDDWSKSLVSDDYLTSLAIEVKNKYSTFELSHNYSDALVKFTISESKKTEWQTENWDNLINILSNPHKKDYAKELTDYFIEKNGEVHNPFFELSINYLDTKRILKVKHLFEEMIDSYIKSKDYFKLKMVIKVFSQNDVSKYYTKDDDRIKVIEERLKDSYKNSDETNREVLTGVAELLEITV